jgi:hypothetical protein
LCQTQLVADHPCPCRRMVCKQHKRLHGRHSQGQKYKGSHALQWPVDCSDAGIVPDKQQQALVSNIGGQSEPRWLCSMPTDHNM